MVVAIHQPNFFPWLGYFNKLARADIFVFLDDVAYPKSGHSMGSWCNRVKVLIQGRGAWIRIPVIREHGTQLIKDVKIDNRRDWRRIVLRTIENNYKKSSYFDENWEWLKKLINFEAETLSEYNIQNIMEIASRLGFSPKYVLQSEMHTENVSTDLLIEITKKVGADTYLCGGGAKGYQEDKKFHENRISLTYQGFEHPIYAQMKTTAFVPGLSIIDAFLHCGIAKTSRMLSSRHER